MPLGFVLLFVGFGFWFFWGGDVLYSVSGIIGLLKHEVIFSQDFCFLFIECC